MPLLTRRLMLHALPAPVKGSLVWIIVCVNTIYIAALLLPIVLLKLLIPQAGWRVFCSKVLTAIAMWWVDLNSFVLTHLSRIHWDIEGLDNISLEGWYLVVSNHRSWADIFVLALRHWPLGRRSLICFVHENVS